jgi:rhodanese-related sulfurtransferase
MDEWVESGHEVASHQTITARQFVELNEADLQVLDVRSPSEWREDHLEDSLHCYLPDLVATIPSGLDRSRPIYVGCTTGHRASTAAGLLAQAGYQPVVMVGASLLGALTLRRQQAAV